MASVMSLMVQSLSEIFPHQS